MTVKIRPMTDLSKKMDEIEALCIEQGLPVYITKKGTERLVVLGHENYENLVKEVEELKEEVELYKKLIQAEGESRRGEGHDFDEVLNEIDDEIMEITHGERRISS
jgi:PHD/YefM family antitoxin component YafN of YafNO toxin-antitoxin module